MRVLKGAGLTLILLVLSHCAAKHQPIEFPGYYALRPESEFSPVQAEELKTLEALADPTAFQKRRMADLYQNEERALKPTTTRYAELETKIQNLRTQTIALDRPVLDLQAEIATYPSEDNSAPKPAVFSDPNLKKAFTEAAQLWNRDESNKAIDKLTTVIAPVEKSLSTGERLRVNNLRFRIFAEAGDLISANTVYLAMKDLDDCSPDTTAAGFLLSILTFAQGNAPAALSILNSQCDKDISELAQQRRDYWRARMKEGQATESAQIYQRLAQERIPSYYSFLAQTRLGQKVSLPPLVPGKAYLSQEFNVSSSIHELLLNAEDRLRANLRKDAMAFLMKASRQLRKSPGKSDVVPLLYIAHLCQAAGNHLEALRIYAQITQMVTQDPELSGLVTSGLIAEMYPRPFADRVDWLGRIWGVDSDYVYSIIRQESAFSPTAVSGSDARGLMQLMPALGKVLSKQWSFRSYYSDRMLFDADENLKLGVFHLKQLDDIVFHPALVAAGYNAGVNRAIRWWKRYGNFPLDVFIELIPVMETRNYVKLVLRNFYFYKNLRTGIAVDPTIVPFQLGPIPAEYVTEKRKTSVPAWSKLDSRRLQVN